MTIKEPTWGTGTSTPDGYALRDSEVVLRLLLPAQVKGLDERVLWRTVGRAFGNVRNVNGYTSWVELTELPGQGGAAPSPDYLPPAGYLDAHTRNQLLEACVRALGDTAWSAVEPRGGVRVVPHSPGPPPALTTMSPSSAGPCRTCRCPSRSA